MLPGMGQLHEHRTGETSIISRRRNESDVICWILALVADATGSGKINAISHDSPREGIDATGDQRIEQPATGACASTTWNFENQPTQYPGPERTLGQFGKMGSCAAEAF